MCICLLHNYEKYFLQLPQHLAARNITFYPFFNVRKSDIVTVKDLKILSHKIPYRYFLLRSIRNWNLLFLSFIFIFCKDPIVHVTSGFFFSIRSTFVLNCAERVHSYINMTFLWKYEAGGMLVFLSQQVWLYSPLNTW